MGQQASQQQRRVNGRQNPLNLSQNSLRDKKQIQIIKKQLQRSCMYQHEGILKISKIPFENCTQMQIENQVIFVQNTKMSLQQLIRHKVSLKKMFTQQQVKKLIQNVIYSLAYLQDQQISYPQLNTNNIFLCFNKGVSSGPYSNKGVYKLLPPVTLKRQVYLRLKQIVKQKTMEYIAVSPEMVIALRCHEHQFKQRQILLKSNVFIFGIILLEVCTLRPSAQCYDLENYDLFDQVITQRIQEIQSLYSNKIAMIIANMLDYDYEERMTPKQLSVWINRELNQNQQQQQLYQNNSKSKLRQLSRQKYIKNTPNFDKNLYAEQQDNQIVKSRLIEQSSNKKKQVKHLKIKIDEGQNQHQHQNQLKVSKVKVINIEKSGEKNSQKRIDVIRTKIIKQKMKAKMDMNQQRQGNKSCSKKYLYNHSQSSSFLNNANLNKSQNKTRNNDRNKQRSKAKCLPNPYFNHNYIAKTPQKQTDICQEYNYSQNRDLGIHDIARLRNNIQGSNKKGKFSYNCYEQEQPLYMHSNINPNMNINIKNINLKYKYNVDDVQNPQISSNRKRNGERFIRIQKQISNYQRSLSSKKKQNSLFDQNKQYKKYRDNERDQNSSEKQLGRLPSYKNISPPKIITDFSHQPLQGSKNNNQKQYEKIIYNINQTNQDQYLKNPLSKSKNQNINYQEAACRAQNYQRQMKPGSNYKAHPYLLKDNQIRKHNQNQYQNDEKYARANKKSLKQSQDLQFIKKQIERSRKLIQQVKRNERQNKLF